MATETAPPRPTTAEELLAEAVKDPRDLTRYLYYLRNARAEGLGLLVAPLDAAVNWSRASSIWPLTFGIACCAIEMMAVGAAKYDLDRFGAGAFRPTPRQADLMIVAGTVTHKMAPRVKRLYDQMPDPKFVMAMGACTIGGGPYARFGYHVVKGIDRFLPVDVCVPGCPPRPEALIDALMYLQRKIAMDRPVTDRYLTPFLGGKKEGGGSMNPHEIHTLLRECFAEAVRDWSEPAAGDSCVGVDGASFHDVCVFLRDNPALQFDFLRLVSAVDLTDRIACVYHLFSYEHAHSIAIRVELDRAAPCVASVSDLWPAAEWHEREAYDMVGVVFEGHPYMRRILLPEDWEGFPLRKDYVAPREYNGLTNE